MYIKLKKESIEKDSYLKECQELMNKYKILEIIKIDKTTDDYKQNKDLYYWDYLVNIDNGYSVWLIEKKDIEILEME